MCAAKSTRQAKKAIDGLINGIPIRTLYIAPTGKSKFAKGIKQYFQNFGEVESIRLYTKGQSQYGFVQYKSADTAKAVLSKSMHRVAKCSLTVKAAHEKHQPDFKTFKPPKQDSPQHILNALNDDCLERVLKLLKLPDLSVAADVCVRFQTHAVDVFKLKYKNVIKYGHVAEFKRRPDKFDVMLRNFGSMIHSLSIDQRTLRMKSTELLKSFNKYMPALKDLELDNFRVDDDVVDVRLLFAKLQKLSLSSCKFTNGAEELLASCVELKQLTMVDVDWDNYCIDQTFPKLEEVTMLNCSTIDDAEFESFISANPTLKQLSICGNSELKSASIIQSIGLHLKNLVELEIDQEHFESKSKFQKGTLSLSRLCSLKKLTLNCIGQPVNALLKKMAEKEIPLEDLSLKNGSIDGSAIKSMSELRHLNEIELENIKNLTDDHVIEWAKKLPQLREMYLEGLTAGNITLNGLQNMLSHTNVLTHLVLKKASNIGKIGMTDYSLMLKSVQDRPEKTSLVIEITGDGDKVNVPEKVLSENREWLWIDEEVEDDDDDDDDAGMPMLAIHMNLLLHHMMMHLVNRDDDDETTEDEEETEMDNPDNGMNFDLD